MSLAEPRERKSHLWARHDRDHYVEEPWVSARLFDVERFVGSIYDPACGFGHIVESARRAGYISHGSDISYRGFGEEGIDFLTAAGGCDNIVTNSPFDIIRPFTEKALKIAERKVATIFPTRRLNAAGAWLQDLPLVQIWYLTPRPSMPPGHVYRELKAADKRPSGGTQDFCWLVFDKRSRAGRVEADWLHRDAPA